MNGLVIKCADSGLCDINPFLVGTQVFGSMGLLPNTGLIVTDLPITLSDSQYEPGLENKLIPALASAVNAAMRGETGILPIFFFEYVIIHS